MVSSADFSSSDKGAFLHSVRGFIPNIAKIPLETKGKTQIFAEPGERVKEGQILARTASMKILSPVPGLVEKIERGRYPDGSIGFLIFVKTGGKFSFLGKPVKERSDSDIPLLIESLSKDEISKKLFDSGVVNTFYSTSNVAFFFKKSKVLSVRLFDDDPTRVCDSFVSENFSSRVLAGARFLAKCTESSLIAVFFDKTSAAQRKLFKDLDGSNGIVAVPCNASKYPSGTAVNLVRDAKIEAKSFSKSGEVRSLLENISVSDVFVDSHCALAAFESVVLERPFLSRFVYVSGGALNASGVIRVKIGTSLSAIAEQSSSFKKNVSRVLVNGSILGTAVQNLDVPVSLSVKSVSFFSEVESESKIYTTVSCIRCGSCRKICPEGIWPSNVYLFMRNAQKAGFMINEEKKIVLETSANCTECSLCNMVCPSRLPLSQLISEAKKCFCSSLEEINEQN